jgi:hypothetical protein
MSIQDVYDPFARLSRALCVTALATNAFRVL